MSKQTPIIITGISGVIGQRVAEYFLNQGFCVIAPARSYKLAISKRKNLLLCKYEKLESSLFKRKIEYIFLFLPLWLKC